MLLTIYITLISKNFIDLIRNIGTTKKQFPDPPEIVMTDRMWTRFYTSAVKTVFPPCRDAEERPWVGAQCIWGWWWQNIIGATGTTVRVYLLTEKF